MRLHLPSMILAWAMVASLGVSGWAMAARDDCPSGQTCYEGHVLEFNPADGPIQFLVIKDTSLTTTTLDGEATTGTAILVEFFSDGDHYTQRGDPFPAYAKNGVLATATTKDTFGLTKIGGS